jgi:hypothetical protein
MAVVRVRVFGMRTGITVHLSPVDRIRRSCLDLRGAKDEISERHMPPLHDNQTTILAFLLTFFHVPSTPLAY